MDQRKNKTILIVEDEEPLRKILSDVLQKNNFLVIEAKNGKESVGLSLSERPDLILLDLLMPEMSGMEALKMIRKDDWGAHVPVIILTNLSADSEKLVESMISERPVCYLIKSDWKIEDVVKKVKEVLKVKL